MLPPLLPHQRFLRLVRNRARRYGSLRADHRHFQAWLKLKRTNLDQAYPILAPLYSPDKGCLARQPTCMLRSCLAMIECGVTSFGP